MEDLIVMAEGMAILIAIGAVHAFTPILTTLHKWAKAHADWAECPGWDISTREAQLHKNRAVTLRLITVFVPHFAIIFVLPFFIGKALDVNPFLIYLSIIFSYMMPMAIPKDE